MPTETNCYLQIVDASVATNICTMAHCVIHSVQPKKIGSVKDDLLPTSVRFMIEQLFLIVESTVHHKCSSPSTFQMLKLLLLVWARFSS